MINVEIEFVARRYHANPWGRNVNEGVAEWPPSPFRLARALIDVFHRRRPDWSRERLKNVLSILAWAPMVELPPAVASHLRCYLHSNTKDPTKKQAIFDAFVALSQNARVFFGYPGDHPKEAVDDLDELLGELNYLGRSESWVRARVAPESAQHSYNCQPLNSGSNAGTNVVQVACIRPEKDYQALASKPKKKGDKKSLSWVEAISLSTSELLTDGWSEPPGQRMVDYYLPSDAMKVRTRSKSRRGLSGRFTCARYALHCKVPPRVLDTVPLAERVRTKLMGIHKKVMGGDPASVSPIFSGKEPDGTPAEGHYHAFYMPMDENGDGRIDHFIIQAAKPFNREELTALDRLRSVWQPDGKPDIEFVLVGLLAEAPLKLSKTFVSTTPFVTGRHHRKGRGLFQDWLADELKRECTIHGLPEPEEIVWNNGIEVQNRLLRWPEFVRSRKGLRPMQGYGCRITFPEPVPGPFALGALCHFGLGMFVPEVA